MEDDKNNKNRGRQLKKVLLYGAILTCLAIPILLRTYQLSVREDGIRKIIDAHRGDKTTVVGVIDAEPTIQGPTQSFAMHVEKVGDTAVDTRILVSVKLYPRYSYGDRLALTGKLALPRNFGNDSASSADSNVSAASGRPFDYVHYLSKDGILYLLKSPTVETLATGQGNFVMTELLRLKQAFLANIYAVLGEPHAALAAGLVIGEKAGLGKDLINDFRRSGLIHIVVLSGYSITIVATAIRAVLSFLPRAVGLVLGATGMVLFSILVGGGATVVRSCSMALLAIFAQLIYRDYSAMRALFITGYFMVVENPYIVLYDPSFQISFLATLGLMLFSKPLEKPFRFVPETFGMRGFVTSTFSTQIAVFPLLIYMMGNASLVGVFANLLVLPIIPLTMLAVFLTGAGAFVSASISLVASAFSYAFLGDTITLVQFFSHIPFAVINIKNYPLWMMWLTYFLYAAVFFGWKKFKKIKERSKGDRFTSPLQNSSRSPPS
jgi:competence protein ComEC